MVGTSIEIRDGLSPTLNRLVTISENPAEIMGDVAGYLLTSTQQRFERETGPDGQKWKPLKARTAAQRVGQSRNSKRRGTANILVRSGRLKTSLSTQSDATSATVGTNVAYAAIHQFGGVIKQDARTQTLSLARIRGTKKVRFVKAGTKGATEREVTIGAREITMPARPYLGINDADRDEIGTIIMNDLGRAVE
ncbi:phage virion morphogenesis protein [Agrobacterium vitis]|uniref:phage virion morphogenesis protein n=1 Tax=Allorhizobium ampelinum TaxID=3025782 RepID=UPI001F187479|nr:phage virion morphogenesis protein [Allorhizobium ampelinum]MCF1485025.1 phage virion morphogenesis protein [Allorhizobium ampelinum]